MSLTEPVMPPETESIKDDKKGVSIASLVLGIVSVVLFYTGPIAIAAGIMAIIFGNSSLKAKANGFSKSGLVLGIVGLMLATVFLVFFIIGLITEEPSPHLNCLVNYENFLV